jgi:hypothetical protein
VFLRRSFEIESNQKKETDKGSCLPCLGPVRKLASGELVSLLRIVWTRMKMQHIG